MSFTTTTNYGLQKPDFNTEIDLWWDFLNDNFDKISDQMKLNADAILTKASASHQHDASTVFNAGNVPVSRLPALTGDVSAAIGTGVTVIGAAKVVNTMLAVGAINTVKGTVNGTSNVDIPFSTISTGIIADNAVTNLKLADMAAGRIKGSVAGGDPADLTGTEVTALLNNFSSTLKGLAPLSGGGTVNFLRADGTWADPATGASGGAINNKTASYPLVLADAGDLIEMNVAGANTVTVPLNSTQAFPIGTRIDIVQMGAGQTTIAPVSGGVTLKASGSKLKLTAQYSGATLMKRGTDDWYVWGDLST